MAAPKGNKFAHGMGGGRPPLYETSDDLSNRISEFFDYVLGESHTETRIITRTDKKTKEQVEEEIEIEVWDRMPEVPNITNLALFLGFESRQSFYDYGDKQEFSYIIKRARLVIENFYEDHLLSKESTGAIFALKNFGWEDKTKVEQTGKDGGPIEVKRKINFNELTDEELDQLISRGSSAA